MKKKIISLCLVLVLALIAIGGATMAYFTDTQQATNVFTVGKVKIDLNEQQREYDENGDLIGLEAFEQNKVLVPTTGSAQETKDRYGMPVAANYVDKIVSVTNTGNTDAYIRILVAVPAALEENDPNNAAYNVLHWNYGNKVTLEGNYDTTDASQPENPAWKNVKWKYKDKITVEGIQYNMYIFTYNKALAPNDISQPAFTGFYLDQNVDCKKNAEGQDVYTLKGNEINYDLSNGIKILVAAQAVQAAGFDTAEAAFAAVTFPTNPWA